MPVRLKPLVSEAPPYTGSRASANCFESDFRIAGEDLPYGYACCYSLDDLTDPNAKIELPSATNATFFAGVIYACRNNSLQRFDDMGRMIVPEGRQVVVVYNSVGLWVPVETGTVPHPTKSVYFRKVPDGNGVVGQFSETSGADYQLAKNTVWTGDIYTDVDGSKAQININLPSTFV